MKYIKPLSFILITASLAGCNGLGKMAKNAKLVTYEVTPNPLEEHGDSVAINVKGSYPAKYFAKKVDLSVTPYIKTATGEHTFKTITEVGEKSQTTTGNKVTSATGGSFTYSDKIAYTPDMRAGEVMVRIKGAQGSKSKDFEPMKIADATIATPLLVKADEKTIAAKDQFKKVVPANFSGQIYYLINTSNVNPNFKVKDANINNKPEMAALDSAIKALSVAPYTMKNISIMGYASPDGTEKLNAGLADARSKSSMKYLMAGFKKRKSQQGQDQAFYNLSSTSEDWQGFQQQLQSSDMGQKDVILRIVSSNTDADAREMEIKKMGKAYTEIADKILPKLRRSAITINADKMSRTDEQISALAVSNPDSLSVEELLYAATMTNDNSKKLSIYKSAERIYPQDWRTSNNTGMVMFMSGDVDGAMNEFNKADKLSANNPVVKNNLGACYSRKGDRKNAAEMYASASGAGPEYNENMGIMNIREGNYSSAVSNYGSTQSFNASLAKLLSGDKDGAMSTIEASPDKDSAEGLYLKAIIAARKGDANGVVSNLKASIAKDSKMKAMAKEDREFIKWYNDSNFKSAVE
jgi:Flp pilus assembly protein TadD/outer membrane protein OmpA-like peptidoglycan-associated protein